MSRSYATTSPSRMYDVTPSTAASGMASARSGYLPDVSSEFRENTLTPLPPGMQCTCARSPSYLYSHVKRALSNRSSTSATPLVGLASMGATGMPGVSEQVALARATPPSSSRGTMTSYDGSSEYTALSVTTAAASSSDTASSALGRPLGLRVSSTAAKVPASPPAVGATGGGRGSSAALAPADVEAEAAAAGSVAGDDEEEDEDEDEDEDAAAPSSSVPSSLSSSPSSPSSSSSSSPAAAEAAGSAGRAPSAWNGGVMVTAWARETTTVLSAMPMRSFPCRPRTMYLASGVVVPAATSMERMRETLRSWDLFPAISAMSLKVPAGGSAGGFGRGR